MGPNYRFLILRQQNPIRSYEVTNIENTDELITSYSLNPVENVEKLQKKIIEMKKLSVTKNNKFQF